MSFSSSQLLELFVLLCTADHFRHVISTFGTASAHAESKSGPSRPDTVPIRLCVLIVSLQSLAHFLVPTVYVLAASNARFQQPPWMDTFALPEGSWKNALRVLACVASVGLQRLSDDALEHLDDQFHSIGRREKPRVVQTGPYAWVRHPLYSVTLLQQVLWSFMFWSYAPLLALVAIIAVFVVKIPIEEEAIQRDEAIREEYHAYMHKVPARLVPHVW